MMNITQALNILKPEGNSFEDLKKAYRKAAKKYHPDVNPDGLELMKIVNAAFEFLKNNKWSYDQTTEESGIDQVIADLFEKIKNFVGIKAEVCGSWLWISGNTYKYKSKLKEYGFKFASKKKKWYWRPEDYKKRTKKIFTMEEIRSTFGSVNLDSTVNLLQKK